MSRLSVQAPIRKTVVTKFLEAYLKDNAIPGAGFLDAALAPIAGLRRLYASRFRPAGSDNLVLDECDNVERLVTALRHFDLRFGCNVPMLFDFLGSDPNQVPAEFDPSPARIHGDDLLAMMRLMRF